MRTSLLLALSLALVGCSDDDPAPLPACEGCTGCCVPVIGCQLGTTTAHCGRGGASCTSCA